MKQKFRRNCEKLVKPDDTLVLAGDHSWGKKLPECEKDLEYISSLPGKKILLRGNHDMFWDAKKTDALNQQFAGKLFFLQNKLSCQLSNHSYPADKGRQQVWGPCRLIYYLPDRTTHFFI